MQLANVLQSKHEVSIQAPRWIIVDDNSMMLQEQLLLQTVPGPQSKQKLTAWEAGAMTLTAKEGVHMLALAHHKLPSCSRLLCRVMFCTSALTVVWLLCTFPVPDFAIHRCVEP